MFWQVLGAILAAAAIIAIARTQAVKDTFREMLPQLIVAAIVIAIALLVTQP